MEDDLYVNLELTKVCRHPSGIVNSAEKFKDEENRRSSHPSEIDYRDLQPPKPSTPHIQEAEPKTGRTVKIISTVLTITLVVTLVIALIIVTANYFQMQIYLKDVDKETRKMIDSFQLQNSSFLSERDLAGFHILGHLSMLQTAVHMLKAKEETASRDQSLLQGLKKIVSLPEITWRWNNSNLYYFSNETRNWNESETFCRSYNAHLSSVLTAEEQAYLRSMKGSGGYWIGLTDAESEGNWTFVDGSELKLRFWAKDQPDNWRGMEDCGHLTVYGDWNDDKCEQQHKWICKMSLTE